MSLPMMARTPGLRHLPLPPLVDVTSTLSGACNLGGVVKRPSATYLQARTWRCHAPSKPRTQAYSINLTQNGLPITERKGISPELDDGQPEIPRSTKEISQMIGEVKAMLGLMNDGEITISAYDTAWVALVRALDGKCGPQFPSSLDWIASHQLLDGSWGDENIFSAHDRMINTLACVIALESWHLCPNKCQRGLAYLRDNMWRLGKEAATLMPIGFEVAFPSLLEIANEMGLEVPYDHPTLQNIYAKRNLKLKKIPREVLHQVPTTLLHSLEGMPGLDWERLLGLQSLDGSFLFSPSSTAYAFTQTGDQKCLLYLQKTVERFNGGVPNVYPVDLFEHIWVVDRLDRLGISRYFEPEIRQCMDYVYSYWADDGICWARNSTVQDVDDTAMGFRLLRLHGYDVSSDVFRNFEKDDEFFCFAGQSNQAVTGMYNLNRASQVMYAGEDILDRAKRFSYGFLREKQASNELMDKWIITKDLPGEVEYALDFPWFASLPRVEARMYIGQYGASSDVWIGKTLYRMPYVNNDLYLELAKSDFNQCQAVHQQEWVSLQKWYEESRLGAYGVSREKVLRSYFLAASCIFEPERAAERVGWAQTAILAEAISCYFNNSSDEKRQEFTGDFINGHTRLRQKQTREGALLQVMDHLVSGDQKHRRHQHHRHLKQAWEEWLLTWREDDCDTALLLLQAIEACEERSGDPAVHGPSFHHLAKLTSKICNRLSRGLPPKTIGESNGTTGDGALDSEIQELIQFVLQCSEGIHHLTKQTFINVTKSYYYTATCPPTTLDEHITKVLFERVM